MDARQFCTGTMWQSHLLTTAHCTRRNTSFLVYTSRGLSAAILHVRNALWTGVHFPDAQYDHALLHLQEPWRNNANLTFRLCGAPDPSLVLIGMGYTSASWQLPLRSVVSMRMDLTRCPA